MTRSLVQRSRRTGFPLPILAGHHVDAQLPVLIGLVGLLVFMILLGIWQKNRIDGILVHNDKLRHEIGVLEDAVAREEIEIAQLTSYERIVPLAESKLGLAVTSSDAKAYIPIGPPAERRAWPFEGEVRHVAAAVRETIDWVLPGTAARALE